jgi:exoribonuclease II
MTNPDTVVIPGSLVLYREQPARVARVGDRLDLELGGGATARVRMKDVELLHPGPLSSLAELQPLPGEMRAAWEILAGGETTLSELAELAFGKFTPASAWAAWQFVVSGHYFIGSTTSIRALSPAEVEQKQRLRDAQETEERAWQAALGRLRNREIPEDERTIKEVELLAYASTSHSRVLRALGKGETPENAHALLLECGHWSEQINPYPRRLGLPQQSPDLPIPELPDEFRRDLTGLKAYAIDDAGTENPDDALSLDGERVWVHVADPAAFVLPGSNLDLEARGRGMTLHLPEGAVHFFPDGMIRSLGLGLQPISPALSFGIELDGEGGIRGVEIVPSWTCVERLSYEDALGRIEEPVFAKLEEKMALRRSLREKNGAISIDMPEAKIRVIDGVVDIHPILPLRSRLIVEEAMILAGEAVAKYAVEHSIPLPFSTQDPPSEIVPHTTLSGMFAMRRLFRRSQHRTTPGVHAGLGIQAYAQATSPLRRSMDLVVHQQLRQHLRGAPLMSESEVLECIGAFDAIIPALRQAEMQSERHWTLVFLRQHSDWQGESVLVEKRGASVTVVLPFLALEGRLHLNGDIPLDARLPVRINGINLPMLEFNLSPIQ